MVSNIPNNCLLDGRNTICFYGFDVVVGTVGTVMDED